MHLYTLCSLRQYENSVELFGFMHIENETLMSVASSFNRRKQSIAEERAHHQGRMSHFYKCNFSKFWYLHPSIVEGETAGMHQTLQSSSSSYCALSVNLTSITLPGWGVQCFAWVKNEKLLKNNGKNKQTNKNNHSLFSDCELMCAQLCLCYMHACSHTQRHTSRHKQIAENRTQVAHFL